MKQNYSGTTQEPKEPRKLTPPRVKVLLAQPSDTWRHVSDGHVDGLALRISPSGFGIWAVDYTRPAGGRARYTLGPEAEITLAKARELALGIRDRARRGEDPHHDKRAARLKAEQEEQQATAGTVASPRRQGSRLQSRSLIRTACLTNRSRPRPRLQLPSRSRSRRRNLPARTSRATGRPAARTARSLSPPSAELRQRRRADAGLTRAWFHGGHHGLGRADGP